MRLLFSGVSHPSLQRYLQKVKAACSIFANNRVHEPGAFYLRLGPVGVDSGRARFSLTCAEINNDEGQIVILAIL
jgi:hypothetical protein